MVSKLDKALASGMKTNPVNEKVDDAMDKTLIGRAATQVQPVIMAKVSSIVSSPYQSKGQLAESKMDELVASIEEEGVLTPLLVRQLPGHTMTSLGGGKKTGHTMTNDGEEAQYELVAGHRRLAASKRLNRPYVPIVVRQMNDAEAARALTAENSQHAALSDWELYKHIVMLRATNAVKNQRELSQVLACSKTKITNLEQFSKLPKEVHAILDVHPELIGYNLVVKLIPYVEQHSSKIIEAAQMIADAKLNQAGVVSWITRTIAKENPRDIPYRKEVSIKNGDANVYFVATKNKAEVSGDIDFDKLHALIESNMHSLKPAKAAD